MQELMDFLKDNIIQVLTVIISLVSMIIAVKNVKRAATMEVKNKILLEFYAPLYLVNEKSYQIKRSIREYYQEVYDFTNKRMVYSSVV